MKKESDFYVVAIGASAGGLDAVQQLFDSMPNNTGIAFVIIQHLSPDFKSLMPELLAKHTKMQIFTAEDNQVIKPNCIYLNQRTKNIGIKNGKFILLDKAPKDHLNLPIDILFHMLGESYRDKALGVILSGTGSDGSRGIKTIKEAGGTILVQEPESAQFNGMPNSAISTNLADFILPPNEISKKIVQFTGKRLHLEGKADPNEVEEKTFQAVLSEIQRYSGVNFKKYKINTLLRRLEKRLSLHNIETLEEYLIFLKKNEKEKIAINQEFLIGVTSFFRDKDAYDVVRKSVVPTICQQKSKQDIIRIWIPGCSSGEEVYSIAILFEDYIRNNKLGVDYKIFATDIDKQALRRASRGSYPVNNCAEIDKAFLEEYFLKSGDKIQIVKKIREKIVFSYHDVTNDPPFIKVDLISCRNLLIYFTNSTQKTVLAGFQFALNKDGILFLGGSESLGSIGKLFRVIDAKQKVFQNNVENKRLIESHLSAESKYRIDIQSEIHNINLPQTNQIAKKQSELFFYKYLSKKHAPVTVFIDADFNVQFIQGDFKKWFSQTDGVFSNNLLNMVNSELATIIRNGIRRLSVEKTSASVKNLICLVDNEKISTDLNFERIDTADSVGITYMVQFGTSIPDQTTEQIVLSNEDVSNFSKQRIEDLEHELKENRAELQNVVEELETSNEELQSSNEELMSSNEELQSSNEELQSVNEELYTVNTEFQEKNKELENLNNDILNLLNSTDIGTLFLDSSLNIRKFTPAVKRIFKLEDTDIGRSIASFASEFNDDTRKHMIADSKIALEKLQTFEKEIQDNTGNWYLKRISPFVTSEKKIEGVVITFVDINTLKEARYDLSESESRLTASLEVGNMAWWEMELPSGKVKFSRKKVEMLGRDPKDFKHYEDFVNIVHPDDKEITMQAMRNHLEGKCDKYECQYRIRNIEGRYQWYQDVGKIVLQEGDVTIVSGIVIEITEKKKTELQLLEAIQKGKTANIYKNQFLSNMSHEMRSPMNGLVGFAQMLREDNLDQETKLKYIDIIESSSKQLLTLINDIIDVSKIEAGELSISYKACHLGNLLKELEVTFDELKNIRGKSELSIKAIIPEGNKNLMVKTDATRLKQILVNLIGNALKFTDVGSIVFTYELKEDKIVFSVTDTGIGMSADKLKIIFERFQQIEHSEEKRYDGTGLGLTISKGLVNLLGGSMRVESKEGVGSIFTFDIPYEEADIDENSMSQNNSFNEAKFKGKKVLIAEDDMINKFYLKEVLKELPITILWAENGVDAVELYKQEKDFDAVLMDIRLPGLDGFKATRKILEMNPDAHVIAQTAYAMSSDKEKCLKNGFVDYVAKPISKDTILKKLAKWL